jgi:PAS domain S-box-containing protein
MMQEGGHTGQGERLRILVVDDEAPIARTLTQMLDRMAFDVRSANSGEEALNRMAESPSDILITDITMPGMSGLVLAEHVARLYSDTIIIGMTGYGHIEMAVDFMKLGGVDFLQKPVEKAVLKLSIESAADRWRLRQELKKTHEALRQKNRDLQEEIAERERSEKALRESRQKYRDVFNNAPLGILHTSLEGQILRVNPSLAAMLGYRSPDDMISSITDLRKQAFARPGQFNEIVEIVLNKDGWQKFEICCIHKQGAVVITALTLHGVRDDQGQILYIEGFMEDVTENKKREEAFIMEMTRAKELYNLILEPRLPDMPGVQARVKCLPAEHVGGDVVEFLQINPKQFLIFLADVTGHGIPAAMTANTLKTLFREIAKTETDPGVVFQHLNRTMSRIILPDDMIALFCGRVDLEHMTLVYYFSGLPFPIIYRNQEMIRLMPTGFPIGVMDESSIGTRMMEIRPGDMLVAFTDGIVEAKSKTGQVFGNEGVEASIRKSPHPDRVVDTIFQDACRFQEKDSFRDDVIVISLNLLGGKSPK